MSDQPRLATLFAQAAEFESDADRSAFLAASCGSDSALRRELEELLAAHSQAGTFMETPAADAATTDFLPNIAERPGAVIGCYKLLEQIGAGGMGLVFMAEQSQPLRRRVALKIIKPGLDTRAVIARFDAERQALALMDHPNIARVFDAGATDSGRPYFVMELVRGIPITDYCRDRNLALCERLELFSDVCHAVQHAHQKGVIHRDLKPTNILVAQSDTVPVPKVIDFGVAKATTQPLTDRTLCTEFSQIIGTPLYMSPEQADLGNQDIDTRSDVYSLGVILYELLTDATPFDAKRLRSAGYDEMRRIIREEEPPKPSTRATTLAAAVTTVESPHKGAQRQIPAVALKGDLDWIVMKALDKDRRRRYESPSALAADLQRYLAQEPILARPATPLHRVGKWTRRHVAAVWTALAVSVVAAVGLGISTVLIAESRDDANEQRQIAVVEKNKATDERNIAVAERNKARLNEYYSEIVSSQIDLDQGNLPRLNEKLIRHLPIGDEPDRRGWEWYYLFSFCHPEQRTLFYPSYVLSASWSPDGEFIGSGGGAVWEVKSGQCIRLFMPSGIYECAWTPDSSQFAWGTLADDSAIYIWNQRTDGVRTLRGHEESVWPLAFSPDGSKLASGSVDQTVKVWDVATGDVMRTLTTTANVTGLAWSPDGELLAVGLAWGGGLKIYSAATGELVHERADTASTRTRLSWRPDGKQLAVNTSTGWLILHCADWTPVVEHKHPYGLTSDSVGVDIQWNPAGNQVAYAERSIVTIWDPKVDKSLYRLAGHLEPVQTISWRCDGRQLLTTDRTREIRIWDLDTPLQPPEIKSGGTLQRLSWEADSATLLAVAEANLSSSFWNASDGKLIKQETCFDLSDKEARVLSPDRHFIASPSKIDDDLEVVVQDAQTGAIHSVYRCEKPFEPLGLSQTKESFEFFPADSLGWSPDGSRLAIAIVSKDQLGLDVWDVNEERRIARWSRPRITNSMGWADSEFHHLTWSPDGKRVAALGKGDAGEAGGQVWLSRVYVIDAATGKRVLKHALGKKSRDGGEITAVAWSPDSRLVAMGSTEGLISVANVDTGQGVMNCKAHDVPIRALTWSPDGTRLASAAADGVMKVMESLHGNELLSLQAEGLAAKLLAWSPDGRRIAGASDDAIHVWDASRGFDFAEGGSRRRELAWTIYQLASANVAPAARALPQVLDLAPKTLDYRTLRANALAKLGQFDKTAREFHYLISPDIELNLEATVRQMYAYLGARDLDAYRPLLARLAEAWGNSQVPSERLEVAWLSCLVPNSQVDYEEESESVKDLLASEEDQADVDVVLVGLLLYRQGQYAECVEQLTPLSAKLDHAVSPTEQYTAALAKFQFSMARQRLGHRQQALRLFREATLARDELQADPSTSWIWLVEVDTIRREAEALIQP